jgi:hypothetical protein
MSYEIFERKAPRMGTPMISFSKIGGIHFNQPASRILQKEAIEYVLLLWDSAGKKIAMKSTANKKDQRAYLVRYNDKGNGASFSAKTFLDYCGIHYSDRKAIPVDIKPNNEMFVEVEIPEVLFKQPEQKPLVLQRTGT